MKITMIAGLHLTAHDRRIFRTMIERGWTEARTPRKIAQLRPVADEPGHYAGSIRHGDRFHAYVIKATP